MTNYVIYYTTLTISYTKFKTVLCESYVVEYTQQLREYMFNVSIVIKRFVRLQYIQIKKQITPIKYVPVTNNIKRGVNY